jgi:hypothetical protein
MMDNKYLYFNPRGFSNEFTIFEVAPPYFAEADEIVDKYRDDTTADAHYISKEQADEMIKHERKLRQEYRAGALSREPVGATRITNFAEHYGL